MRRSEEQPLQFCDLVLPKLHINMMHRDISNKLGCSSFHFLCMCDSVSVLPSVLILIGQPDGRGIGHMTQFTFSMAECISKGIHRGRVAMDIFFPWTPWSLSAKSHSSNMFLTWGKSKAQWSCSNSLFTKVYFKKQQKKKKKDQQNTV